MGAQVGQARPFYRKAIAPAMARRIYMEQSSVEFLQEEARQAYERTSGVEAFQCLQAVMLAEIALQASQPGDIGMPRRDRKSTRLNSSHTVISYAVFCL